MTNREIYDAALSLLAEEQEELCDDYQQRAPYILATFFCECREVNTFYRAAHRQSLPDEDDLSTLPSLDGEFPLSERFFSAGVFYMAAMLVEMENEQLCDRLFSRYADAISRITREGTSGHSTTVRDVYGFHRCD